MIIHDEAHCRFLQEDPKGTAYMEYTCAGNILTVTHTKVPNALAGRGIAGKLASAFYEWASRHQLHRPLRMLLHEPLDGKKQVTCDW